MESRTDRLEHTEERNQSVDLGPYEVAHVELGMGVGELEVNAGTPKLMEGNFRYDSRSCEPIISYHPGPTRADLSIGQNSSSHSVGDGDCHWFLKLNAQKAMDIEAKMGVGEARLNLGSLNLRSVSIKIGVGEVNLDLRGTPARSYDVHIAGGIGSAKVYLPKSVNILATATGGIGDISAEGLEKRGSYWVNAEQEKNPVTVRVDASGGVGEITLIAE